MTPTPNRLWQRQSNGAKPLLRRVHDRRPERKVLAFMGLGFLSSGRSGAGLRVTLASLVLGGLATVSVAALPAPVAGAGTPSTTWTEQSPATSPPARDDASMAYDPSTGNMVLFGGYDGSGGYLNDTWTWDGTTWTQQSPVTSPPARYGASMAYDPATGNTVLFGGVGSGSFLNDTWTWDGTTWTEQSPVTSPPARDGASMAYDPSTGDMVLFGGNGNPGRLGDTWTWDGTTWTQQSPVTSPPARVGASMAYDPSTGNMVLFGGAGNSGFLDDTWTYGPITSGPLQITTTSLPGGTVGQPYSFALQAVGGNPPYTWWYAKGGDLPRDLHFSTSGVLSGTPKRAGNYSITFRVRDTAIAGHHVNKAHAALTVTITIT